MTKQHQVKKYVVTKTLSKVNWKNSFLIKDNVVKEIQKLKEQDGLELQVPGSGKLIQILLKHDLVDEIWLKIHPLTLGKGKKLFDDDARPAAFTLIESLITPNEVIIANYKRAGKVKTGTIGD